MASTLSPPPISLPENSPALHNGSRNSNYYHAHWGNDIASGQTTVGEWKHIAFVYVGGTMSVYENGLLIPGSVGDRGQLTNPGRLLIGRTVDRYSSMSVDDVAVWSGALKVEEIELLADGTSPLELTPPPPGIALVPGDANLDGALNLSDPVALLNALFAGVPLSECMMDGDSLTAIAVLSLDWQGDGGVNLSGGVAALDFLFGGGVAHALGEGCQLIEGEGCDATCDA